MLSGFELYPRWVPLYELCKVFHNGDTVTNWQTYMINLESHVYSTLRAVVKPLHVGYAYTATYDIYIKKFYYRRVISLM